MKKGQLTARQKLFCEHYVGAGRHCAALSARMAGYAPGCSHVTGCQLLKQPKIAATVRGLEAALAREIGVSRHGVIAQLMGAAELARELKEPAAMISAFRNIGQICGYYRQEGAAPGDTARDQAAVQANFAEMTDAQLLALIASGGGVEAP